MAAGLFNEELVGCMENQDPFNMLKVIQDFKKSLHDSMAIPNTLLIPRRAESSYHEAAAKMVASADSLYGRITPWMNQIQVIVSDYLPKLEECVGHEFNNPPPARNRSLRLWKKLRYGLKNRFIKPIMQEMECAFVFNKDVMARDMQKCINDDLYKSMCGIRMNAADITQPA